MGRRLRKFAPADKCLPLKNRQTRQVALHPLWLRFADPDTEAWFVAERLEMKHSAALVNLRIGAGAAVLLLLLLVPSSPVLALRYWWLGLLLAAVVVAVAAACHHAIVSPNPSPSPLAPPRPAPLGSAIIRGCRH